MVSSVSKRDSQINFPDFTIIKASAGSGKTFSLSFRFVQFAISNKIQYNGLNNLLAITFSNNATKEMKDRIIRLLKLLILDDRESLDRLGNIVGMTKEEISKNAMTLLDNILNNYPDLQIKTIDSFMAGIFKASSIELGFSPDFEIVFDNKRLINYAFDLYLNKKDINSTERISSVIEIISKAKDPTSSYLWDPADNLLSHIVGISKKTSGMAMDIEPYDTGCMDKDLIDEAIKLIDNILTLSQNAHLQPKKNTKVLGQLQKIKKTNILRDILDIKLGEVPFLKSDNQDYKTAENQWVELKRIQSLIAFFDALTFFNPYVEVLRDFQTIIEGVKRQEGQVFIGDINRLISRYLSDNGAFDVFFKLVDIIYHFMIDEFQDTSPIQWENLRPLIENALAANGSLFIVGDTKQSIYGFRDADFRIMKELEEKNPFLSVNHKVETLNVNYRSDGYIVNFVRGVFENLPDDMIEKAKLSGLTEVKQDVVKDRIDKGYVQNIIVKNEQDEVNEAHKVLDIINDLYDRGYNYRDIAILTQRNEKVVEVSSWLNEREIPFISFSSLDIRKRPIICEIVSLVKFLDSPTDNLSFVTFLLGDVFNRVTGITKQNIESFAMKNRQATYLYKKFQEEYNEIWDRYFSGLFSRIGYLPMYDLMVEIYMKFNLLDLYTNEEAALIKFLDVIRELEGDGYNSVRDLLDIMSRSDEDNSRWDMPIPQDLDAIKVMTIHKSKGLGFKAVIALLYEQRFRGFDYIIGRIGESESVSLLRITSKQTVNETIKNIYEENRTIEEINILNSLYVCLTRAQHELYIIQCGKAGKDNYGLPLKVLPSCEFYCGEKMSFTSDKRRSQSISIDKRQYKLKDYNYSMDKKALTGHEERQRGEFIHKVLSYITFISEDIDADIDTAIGYAEKEISYTYERDNIKKLTKEAIEDLKEHLRYIEGRVIYNEYEVCDREGNIKRLDKVILDGDFLNIIEFKTGNIDDHYKDQVQRYMAILSEIFKDKKITAIIYYVDLKKRCEFRDGKP
ncbi:MAG: UvrD-helicase domain-containing protein [Thermodesulfovibrionales bacterium]